MPYTQSLIDGQKSISLSDPKAYRYIFGDEEPSEIRPIVAASTVGYVSRCLDLRANGVSSLPWEISGLHGEDQLATNKNFEDFPWLDRFRELLYLTETSMSCVSEAYWFRQSNVLGEPLSFRWLAADTMEPIWSIWDGIVSYKRRLGAQFLTLSPDEVVYFPLPNAYSETEPGASPVETALADAGVLLNANRFSQAFFKRGAIRATILTVDGPIAQEEAKKLKTWWSRAFRGIGKAFSTEVFTRPITPVVVGDGLSELSNSELTNEKREAISTAMGVPHSLVMSNAANFATADADRLNFYDLTVLPSAQRIEQVLNKCVFEPQGLKFKFTPQELAIYQEDEEQRALGFSTYVGAGMLPSIAAEMLGLNLPVDIDYKDLDPEEPDEPETEEDDEPETTTVVVAQEDGSVAAKRKETAQFKSWCRKRGRPDLSKFRAEYLTEEEKKDIALGEVAGGEDATFPVSWAEYP